MIIRPQCSAYNLLVRPGIISKLFSVCTGNMFSAMQRVLSANPATPQLTLRCPVFQNLSLHMSIKQDEVLCTGPVSVCPVLKSRTCVVFGHFAPLYSYTTSFGTRPVKTTICRHMLLTYSRSNHLKRWNLSIKDFVIVIT